MNRQLEVTVGNGPKPFFLDFDAVIPDGVEAYYAETITGAEDSYTLNLMKINADEETKQRILPRNTGVILKAAAPGTFTFKEADVEGAGKSLLTGFEYDGIAEAYDVVEVGYKRRDTTLYNYYKLAENETFVKMDLNADTTFNCTAYEAYLKLPVGDVDNVGLAFFEKGVPQVTVYDGNADSFMTMDSNEAKEQAKSVNALFFTKDENDQADNFIYNGKAKSIVITDAQPFYCPTEFVAEKVSYTRNFKNTGWQALYLPFSLSYAEWAGKAKVAYINNVHQFDDDDDGVIDRTLLEFVTKKSGNLEANTPYVIKVFEAGEYTFTGTDKTLAATTEDGYVDCMSTKTKYTLTGTYQELSDLYKNKYYAMSNGSFMQANSPSVKLSPFRIFLKIENRNGVGSVKMPGKVSISVDGIEEGTTGIDGLETQNSSLETQNCYNLQGQKVGRGYKGIVIRNGKKILVK